MKKLFSISTALGVIIILIAVLFKQFHWPGEKGLITAGVCVLLFSMLIYLAMQLRKSKT
jgi:hypothetical protein